ncbi:MAG: mechanosensitive ion channel domain-containing protein [Salinibacter sp.]|jgi:Small-conductance mechanosensitive channel|uniref:mechanosensitive ion channel family protein n=1 Tax=Salinibacter sp. TaxID=2065818 RepID=UPI002FC367A0
MESLFADSLLSTDRAGLEALLILGGAALLGGLAYAGLHRLLRSLTREADWTLPLRGALLRRSRGPLRILVPVLCVYAALPAVRASLSASVQALLENGLRTLVVVGVAWGLLALLYAVEEAVSERYDTNAPDNLKARKIVTQTRILRRIAATVVVVVAGGIVLMQYEPFRELGTGLLASAGIVGIVVGVAAQRTIGDLIAGIQIALTQPIRVDDVVIVEGDFGWVEEITLTYVVVRVWDRRRIVLPITHFVEQPFQNWTRTSADLIGTVFLYLDYTVPVEALRAELHRIVEASEHWDGDVVGLQMTDASERTITLRAIASAKDAPTLWNLRCEIREKLVAYVREHYPEALPALRARVGAPGDGEAMPSSA